MKILVVITRLYATRGSENDEFVQNWDQDPEESHEIFDRKDRKILLLHGEKERWDLSNPGAAVSDIISEIRNILGKDMKGGQLGLLFHPRSDDTEFSSTLKKEFRRSLTSVESVPFTELHSQGQIDRNTSIARLAKAIREGEEWRGNFESVWEDYGIDKILETKLDILHSCMTPDGADDFLLVNKWEEMPEEIRELDDIRREIDQLKNYEKDDYLESNSDYMAKLTDLRDQLLGTS